MRNTPDALTALHSPQKMPHQTATQTPQQTPTATMQLAGFSDSASLTEPMSSADSADFTESVCSDLTSNSSCSASANVSPSSTVCGNNPPKSMTQLASLMQPASVEQFAPAVAQSTAVAHNTTTERSAPSEQPASATQSTAIPQSTAATQSITAQQTVVEEKTSTYPRLDPRAKLVLLLEANLLLFFHVNTQTEALLTVMFLAPLFVAGKVRSGVRFTLIYAVLLVLSLIETPTEGQWAWLAIVPMLAVGIRMLLPCLITGAYAFTTTTPGEFTAALRRIHAPEAVVIPCIVVIRFFPTLREDYRHIRQAMALRGIPSGGGSLLRHPAQSLEYIIVPLLMNATTVAQDLSVAALTKGLGNPGRHTSMSDIRMTVLDWVYMAACLVPFTAYLAGVL